MRVHGTTLAILSLGLLVFTGRSWADVPKRAVKPSTERKLVLPDTSDRYADVELPAHFKKAAALRFDNTPRDIALPTPARRLAVCSFMTRVFPRATMTQNVAEFRSQVTRRV